MSALILVGASGLARESLEAVRSQGRYEPIGIVDDDPARRGELINGVKVLGGLDVVVDHPRASLLLCTGNGSSRRFMHARLDVDESRYATAIHPSVEVPPSCTVGPGSVLLAGSVLTAEVTVGRHVVVMANVTLTHDDVVEDFVTICAGVTVGGGVSLGERAYLGMSSSVRQGCRIGAGATIGMGAVVLRDVPAGELWFGVPAQQSQPHRIPNLLVKGSTDGH